jgi:hypothetical protein
MWVRRRVEWVLVLVDESVLRAGRSMAMVRVVVRSDAV